MAITITKPLEIQKQEFIFEVNKQAGDKILAVYPDYKQRNMTVRYLELSVLGRLDTQEALDIKGAWEWIKNVREASNTTNQDLQSASDMANMKVLLAQFTENIGKL